MGFAMFHTENLQKVKNCRLALFCHPGFNKFTGRMIDDFAFEVIIINQFKLALDTHLVFPCRKADLGFRVC